MTGTRRVTTGTDIGDRYRNEDRHGWHTYDAHERHTVGVVCDGLGGHPGGAEAAEAAKRAFLDSHAALAWNIVLPAMRLNQALRNANAAVGDWEEAHPELRGMCTTLTAFEMERHSVRWISVGDSVLYHWCKQSGQLVQLNTRHNDPGTAHFVSSVLSGYDMPLIDLRTDGLPVADGDWIIAASDGLDTLAQDQIQETAQRAASIGGHLAQMLIREVQKVEKVNQDNTTVVAVQAGQV